MTGNRRATWGEILAHQINRERQIDERRAAKRKKAMERSQAQYLYHHNSLESPPASAFAWESLSCIIEPFRRVRAQKIFFGAVLLALMIFAVAFDGAEYVAKTVSGWLE